jgi:FMN phosphatase YigB (HAD superfamily)
MGKYNFIFDLDGTLYKFDRGKSSSFAKSRFCADIRANACLFLSRAMCLPEVKAKLEFERIRKKYDGQVSLGMEVEFGLDRNEYFENTWNLDPNTYIESDNSLALELGDLQGRVALLTAAPRIWATQVLSYLNLNKLFGSRVYTGEPDLRKPNPEIIKKIAEDLGVSEEMVFSIGDEENSDILPAKSVGMYTVLIGKSSDSVADYQAESVTEAMKLLREKGFI